jgi:parallel beta-helix repeat protein
MKVFWRSSVWVWVMFLALAASTGPSYGKSAAGLGTPINSLPFEITAPGHYYLTKNLTSPLNGIMVNSHDVTIDLMGFTITGPGSGSGANYGITSYHHYAEVRNGTIEKFGKDGIHVEGSYWKVINVRTLSNGDRGIQMFGSDHLVTDCSASYNLVGISALDTIISNNNASYNHQGIVASRCNILGNVANYNETYGFLLQNNCLLDQNTALNNTTANYRNDDGTAVWGVNAGK